MAHPAFFAHRGLSLIGRVSALEHPPERCDSGKLLRDFAEQSCEHFKAHAQCQMSARKLAEEQIKQFCNHYGAVWVRDQLQAWEKAQEQHTGGRY